MKIVVIGGTGLIGSKTVAILRKGGHDVVAASPNSGVNTITGEGVKEALAGAQVVIDLANSPSFEDKAVLEFFETAGRNLLPAEAAAGVRHHVALSIVAIDRTDNGYFRAKLTQEKTDRGLRGPLHDHPRDPIHGIPPRHRRFKCGRKHRQASARPVPTHRGGRRCCHRLRCGARRAKERHCRDRWPGAGTIQRDRRTLSKAVGDPREVVRDPGHNDFAMVGHTANPSTSRSGSPPRRSTCH